MKKTASSVPLRVIVAAVSVVSFVLFVPSRLSIASTPDAAATLKTAAQYKAEAGRYDTAIRAIAGIANMKLETPDDLKKAIAIVNGARPNLNLFLSKSVAAALTDSTFANGVKKRSPNKPDAGDLITEVNADRKTVLKLEGAEALKTRIEQSLKSDAAILQLSSERLKTAAEKIKKSTQRTATDVWLAPDVRTITARFTETRPVAREATSVRVQDPVLTTFAIITGLAIGAVLLELVAFAVELFEFKPAKDDVNGCFDQAQRKCDECQRAANLSPFPLNVVALAICDSQLLADQAICLLQ